MNADSESVFSAVLRVFREFDIDLDADIEGCNAEELREIEAMTKASRTLKQRIVAHLTEGADARGIKSWESKKDE